MDALVARHTDRFLHLWEGCPENLPQRGIVFSPDAQHDNERKIEREIDRLPRDLDSGGVLSESQFEALRRQARRLLVVFPFVPKEHLDDRFLEDCSRATRSFVSHAHRFDASLTNDDIHQALRNLWVFNSIQGLLGVPVSLTPSSFAYSLLYPYTDNVLDDSSMSPELKRALLDSIDAWIEGGECVSHPPLVLKVKRLLEMIEDEFPRERYPGVVRSLRAIHIAQQKGLALQSHAISRNERALAGVTVEKGGTSVLADGFLVRGSLSERESEALFGYGVLLQFIDDLNDLAEDEEAGHSTPFVRARASGRLDAATARLLHLVERCCAILKREERSTSRGFHRLIGESARILVAGAVARYERFYPDSFVARIERSTPVGLSFLRKLHAKIQHRLAPAPEAVITQEAIMA